jgi:hypothetical protein
MNDDARNYEREDSVLSFFDIQDFNVWGQQKSECTRSVTICEYFVTYIRHAFYLPTIFTRWSQIIKDVKYFVEDVVTFVLQL